MTLRPIGFHAARRLVSASLLAATAAAGAAGGAGGDSRFGEARPLARLDTVGPRIVNGVPSFHPNLGLVARRDFAAAVAPDLNCSGFLVGCSTFVTAAQCFTPTPDPDDYVVFLPLAGYFDVHAIHLHPTWNGDTTTTTDLAVLDLRPSTSGIRPVPINRTAKPPSGTAGLIFGFGSTSGEDPYPGIGAIRAGNVATSACAQGSDAIHTCFDFAQPVGAPGERTGFCAGDVGGPLLVQPTGLGPRLGAVLSGRSSTDCQPDATTWNPDVFTASDWIASVAGSDLDAMTCGNIPQAFDSDTAIYGTSAELGDDDTGLGFALDVPSGASTLRLSLYGALDAPQDFDLYVWHDDTPPGEFECISDRTGHSFEYCEVRLPASGRWRIGVARLSGSGPFSVTGAVLGVGAEGACVPGPTTLCIDDQPGDRRFRAEVYYETTQGSQPSGPASAIALADKGVPQGGLFTFTNPANPEMLLKVLNACVANGHYWVFYSAGTNFRLVIRVTDTVTGAEWISENPDRTLAASVAALDAFDCSVE